MMDNQQKEMLCDGTQTMKPIYHKSSNGELELIGWIASSESKIERYFTAE